MTDRHKHTIAASLLAGAAAASGIAMASPASADNFAVCASGKSGLATADTSCAFGEIVHRARYSEPGTIVTTYSPVTNQPYTMQCTTTPTNFWPTAQHCVGVNNHGAGLSVSVVEEQESYSPLRFPQR